MKISISVGLKLRVNVDGRVVAMVSTEGVVGAVWGVKYGRFNKTFILWSVFSREKVDKQYIYQS